MLVYVDDFLLMASDMTWIVKLKELFKTNFQIKEIGAAKHIIGVQFERLGTDSIYIGQPAYAEKLLREFDMWETEINGVTIPIKHKSTPMVVGWTHNDSSPKLSREMHSRYRTCIMSLMYLVTNSRPDMMYATCLLSQFQVSPTEHDWDAAMYILRYLRGTYDYGLVYTKANITGRLFSADGDLMSWVEQSTVMYADAGWAQEKQRRSRSGFVFMCCGAALTWFCKVQPVISLSSTESELYALSDAVRDVIWLRQFLEELGISFKDATVVYQDNKSTIAVAVNPVNHKMTKHIAVRTFHFREQLELKRIIIIYCPTDEMLADGMTKALPPKPHTKQTEQMGLRS